MLCLGALVWWIAGLQRDVAAEGFATVETQRARIDVGAGWFDPRWEAELAERVAAFGPVSAGDRNGLARLTSLVASLPFVAGTAAPEVLWPDGLRIAVDLRAPVACVRTEQDSFLPVAPDGTVLPGEWRVPPACGWGFLPRIVLGRKPARPLFPGDVLDGLVEIDALAVAVSMWDHLQPEDLAALGRVVIDARRARATSVTEPGTRLLLEGRTILFGRSPASDEPGELPAELKWQLVARALALLPARSAPGEGVDWAEVDVRWDYGTLAERASEAR